MANASLSKIYNQMHDVGNYHPFTADTYADWSLEAGDIVTVERNGVQSASPVHTATVRWNGSQRVTLESRGEKKREPVAKMSAKAFNSGGNGGGAYRSGYGGWRRTTESEEKIVAYAQDIDKGLQAEITIRDDQIKAEAKKRADDDRELSGKITVQAERIDVVLTENNQVKAGVIVEAINKDSSVTILANRIKLEGNVNLNEVMSVSGNYVRMKKPVVVDNSYVQASELRLRDGSSGATLTGSNMEHVIISASLKDNTLTLTPLRGDPINFSKATTLKGSWSSSTRRYTATAYQKNNGKETKVGSISTVLAASIAGSDIAWDGTYWGYATIKAQDETGKYVTAATNVLINAKEAYDAGARSVPTYSNSEPITYIGINEDYDAYCYVSDRLITDNRIGAAKTVHYN